MNAQRAAPRCQPLIIALAGLLMLPTARADAMSPQRQRELIQTALNAFDEAVAVARENPPQAEQFYRQSAEAFESLIESGIYNAAIEYNLGNACFRLKDLGRAIVHFRRAQEIDPSDARIAANLAYARQRVEPAIAASGETELLSRLAFWTRSTSRQTRFWIATFASTAGWAGLFAWIFRRNRGILALSVLAIVIALANAATIAQELRAESATPAAVVSRPNTILREGRGENHDAVLRQPLGPGVEVVILAQRGDWCEVQLANRQSGWVPDESLLRVAP
jgi:tetratricopeptide (TPR) repeat protein